MGDMRKVTHTITEMRKTLQGISVSADLGVKAMTEGNFVDVQSYVNQLKAGIEYAQKKLNELGE